MPVEQIVARVRRALLLDFTAFEEARDDSEFTPAAAAVAGAVILIAGAGSYLWAVVVDVGDRGEFFMDALILGSIFLALLWLAGVGVTYAMLTQLYHHELAPDALFRICAIAFTPFALGLLVFLPGVGFGFGVLSVALVMFYTVTGLRAAFPDLDPLKTLVSVAAGLAVWTMLLPLLSSGGDPFTPGVFVYEWSEDVVEDLGNYTIDLGDFNIDFGQDGTGN